MNTYKVKAYFNGLLRMQAEAKGMRQAQAVKRVYINEYGFLNNEIDIVKIR